MDDADAFDKLLESVDLSSYGLQRVKLNHSINLNADETPVDPQNPNHRGVYGGDSEMDPLDEIIRTFNERWFQGLSATPEEQRIKFIKNAESVRQYPDFESKYKNNPDPVNRELVYKKILNEVMLCCRKEDMGFYKLFASDMVFETALTHSTQRYAETMVE